MPLKAKDTPGHPASSSASSLLSAEPQDDHARLEQVEAEATSLRTQLAVQQGRIDELSNRKPSPPDRLPPLISGTGAAVSSSIAVAGFGIVHWLSVRRQRRDEFFKRMQDCLTILERVGRGSSKVWRRNGKDKDALEALEFLQSDIDALTYRLALMKQLKPKFNIDQGLFELKREATLHVEDSGRSADVARADRAQRLAENFAGIILKQFDQVYG